MITKVWGIINSENVDFESVPDRPGYWSGVGPRVPGIQDIEIWAESASGAKCHLNYAISIQTYGADKVRLMLSPYRVRLLNDSERRSLDGYGKCVL